MSLFQQSTFKAHSGSILTWKIDCDFLSSSDLDCLAYVIKELVGPFGSVVGVPRGGLLLALKLHRFKRTGPLLIVDDVLTSGRSIATHRARARSHSGQEVKGAVIFARSPCPDWVTPVFQLTQEQP